MSKRYQRQDATGLNVQTANKRITALQRRVRRLEETQLSLLALLKLSAESFGHRIELKAKRSRVAK